MAWQRKQLMRAAAAAALAVSATTSGVVLMAQDNPDTQVETQAARPFLGVRLTEGANGVEVVAVGEGSPAEAAGIEAGDILVRIGDAEVTTVDEAAAAVAALAVGDTVSITVQRDGEAQSFDATLVEAPAANTREARPGRGDRDDRREEIIGRLGGFNFEYDSETNQWVVGEVAEDSALYEAGLRSGDVITAVNGEALDGPNLLNLFSTLRQSDAVTLSIERDGEAQDIEVATADLFATDGMPHMFQFGGLGGNLAEQLMNRFENLPFSYDEETGALTVGEVAEDSALYEAGLRSGDVITAVNGEIPDASNLREILHSIYISDTLTLSIERDGAAQDIEVATADLFSLEGMPQIFQFGGGIDRGDLFQMFGTQRTRLGLSFIPLDEEAAAENNVTVTEGALVMEVTEDSPAAEAGFQAGDIVTAVNGEPINAEWTLRDRISAYEPGDVVTLDVLRGDESIQLEATLGGSTATFSQGMMMPFDQLFGQSGMPFGFDMQIPLPGGEAQGGAQTAPSSPNV
ncbi:MAG: 2-alkenal reductase [Chloroflexi bacterium OLB15]|nr:MAG: 2-alkenal reductase [Chloroflexi bacterium OLB15]